MSDKKKDKDKKKKKKSVMEAEIMRFMKKSMKTALDFVRDGSFYVAMSSKEGKQPVIWHDGQLDTLRFNGCVSSISFAEAGEDYSSQVNVRD